MSPNTLYWLFSTEAQILAAALSIAAVLAVFKFQWIQSSIEWNRRDLVESVDHFATGNYHKLTLEKQIEFAEKSLQAEHEGFMGEAEAARYALKIIVDMRNNRKVITDRLKYPCLSLGIGILITLILLLFVEPMANQWQGVVVSVSTVLGFAYVGKAFTDFIQLCLERGDE